MQPVSDAAARVVIDCDPGRDDALAILAALGSPALQVDFISTVAGNVTVETAASNALHVLAVSGIDDVPVYVGASRPLGSGAVPDPGHHGDMAGSGNHFPDHHATLTGPAAPALRDWCRTPAELPKRLIAIGPLTNIGALLREDPDALRTVDELYIMGGTVSRMATRVSPTAEFNFYSDPEAVDLVLRSGVGIRLFDYDATTSCQIPTGMVPIIAAAIGAPVGGYVEEWLQYLWGHSNRPYGRQGIAVHDLYAVAGAAGIAPGRWLQASLTVDKGAERRGTLDEDPGGAVVHVARDISVEAMSAFLTSSAANLSGPRS